MSRNLAAAALQVVGLAVAVAGAFAVSLAVGAIATGAVVALVGVALESDR